MLHTGELVIVPLLSLFFLFFFLFLSIRNDVDWKVKLHKLDQGNDEGGKKQLYSSKR